MTLEDDIAERLVERAHESRKPFKAVVNEALRRGLGEPGPKEAKFRINPHPGNLRPGIDDRRLNEFPMQLEEERFFKQAVGPKQQAAGRKA